MTTLRRAWEGVLDLVYPPTCLLCGTWDAPLLCSECLAGFTAVPTPACLACGHPIEPGVICRLCEAAADRWGGWAFTYARGAGLHRGTLRYALHLLKYRQKDTLGEPLGAWLANRCVVDGLLPHQSFDAIVALPMEAQKERRRGYNQARLLAEPVAALLGVPLLPPAAFQRIHYTEVQMRLSATERANNSSATDFRADESVTGKRCLLIDDVMTTGATLQAAAEALRIAGASRVDAVVLSLG